MKYLQVALNVPLNQTFTYSALSEDTVSVNKSKSDESQKDLFSKRAVNAKTFPPENGKRVEVKFGNKRMTGIITKIFDELPKDLGFDEKKIRPIVRVPDESPILTEELLTLGSWMSSYYLCPIGEVLNSIIPSGKRESESSAFSFVEEF